MKKHALISVSDKTGLTDFATELVALGYTILSTGGTAKTLTSANIPCTDIADVTGFPECLDGRVKTLHPTIHAGILALRNNPDHMKHVTHPIEIVCVNLYPFLETIKATSDFATIVEKIDIGGPTMLRAAAKNYQHVMPVCDPSIYTEVITRLKTKTDDIEFRKSLMAMTFRHTAFYDAVIAQHLTTDKFPTQLTIPYEKHQDMRYGENPHQLAAFYREPMGFGVANAKQLNGKELSFNNINDANAAIACVAEFNDPACVAVKHATPCGVAIGKNVLDAYNKAHSADPESIFGGIVAFNRTVDKQTATELTKTFLEVIIAPDYDPSALEILRGKPNLRVLSLPINIEPEKFDKKFVSGGLLLQTADISNSNADFSALVAKHLKSNAIVLAKDGQTIGLGGGQTSRVESMRIALRRAGNRAAGCTMASDGFFPFNDTIQMAIDAGITQIIQPGGSKNDEKAIALCAQHNIPMTITGTRHFRH